MKKDKFRLGVVWDWPPVYTQVNGWQDGLAAALKELRDRGHEVQVFMPAENKDDERIMDSPLHEIIVSGDVTLAVEFYNPDVILCWGDCTRPNALPLAELGKPMALCFAGGEVNGENRDLFDHIFVESGVYAERLDMAGFNNYSIAFGTNTDLYEPTEQAKVFDTILPATFATWKRHELYAQATQGLNSLAVGYMYKDHETECWEDCLKYGTTILPHVSAEALRYLYAASRVCVVTSESSGGSQRTVLEAMAMNIPVVVTDSDKFDFGGHIYRAEPTIESIRGYVQTLLDGEQSTNTRDYILARWSHKIYATELEAGLESIL
jgi:glycosyltransferase involved in cell wall biosynthesis